MGLFSFASASVRVETSVQTVLFTLMNRNCRSSYWRSVSIRRLCSLLPIVLDWWTRNVIFIRAYPDGQFVGTCVLWKSRSKTFFTLLCFSDIVSVTRCNDSLRTWPASNVAAFTSTGSSWKLHEPQKAVNRGIIILLWSSLKIIINFMTSVDALSFFFVCCFFRSFI